MYKEYLKRRLEIKEFSWMVIDLDRHLFQLSLCSRSDCQIFRDSMTNHYSIDNSSYAPGKYRVCGEANFSMPFWFSGISIPLITMIFCEQVNQIDHNKSDRIDWLVVDFAR
jgi:hypothetical protein